MIKYKAVFFDLDGTLADTDLMIVATMQQIYDQYRPDYIPSLKELISFSGPPLVNSMREHFPNSDTKELVDLFRELSPKLYKKYVKLFPNVQETLKELHQQGIKIVVITSKMRDATIFTLKMLEIYDYFDLLVCFDDVSKCKPDPEGIINSLNAFSLNTTDVLYVGDTYTDYQAAMSAKVDCALVGWGLRGVPALAKPNYVLQSFDEIIKVITNGK